MGVRDKIQGKEYLLRDLWNLLREGLRRLIRVLRLAAGEWDYLREPRNAESMKLLRSGLKSLSSGISPEAEEGFIYAFYPFLFGIYPYTNATQKQQEAMRLAGIKYPTYTIKELSYSFISRQLQAILQ